MVADGSTIPSIRKAQADSMYFKEPELWITGQTETDYLQLKKYIDPTTNKESWWFAKSAAVLSPVAMGTSPFGDDNWTLYTPEDLFISGKPEYESVYQTLKGKAAEAGYNLVRGSFEEGGSLTNTNDVLWYQADGRYYNWYDGSEKTIFAGSTPINSGGISPISWVDRAEKTLREYLETHKIDPNAHQELSNFITSEANRAEVAAEAATLNSDIYPNISSGLAATVSGQYFSIVSSSNSGYLDLYINSSGSAVLLKTYPSTNAIDDLQSVFDKDSVDEAFEFQANNGDVLMRIDSSGVHSPEQSSFVSNIEDKDGKKQLSSHADDLYQTITYQANNGDVLLAMNNAGVKITDLEISNVRSSKRKETFIPADILPSAVVASGVGLRAVNHILLLGRSLAAGRGIIRYTEPLYKTLSAYGMNSIEGKTDPCSGNINTLLDNTQYSASPLFTEKFHHFAVDHCLQLLERHKNINPSICEPKFVTSVFALGGHTTSQLSTDTLPYLYSHIETTKELVEASGYSYNFAGIIICQLDGTGEDGAATNGIDFKAAILSYLNTIRGYAESITGRAAKSIPVFSITQPNAAYFGTLESEGNIAFYLMSKDDENIFYSSTTNMCEGNTADNPAQPDNLHKSGYGTLSAGMNVGRCMYRYFFGDGDGSGLKPVSVTANNNVILLKLNRGNLYFRSSTHNNTSYFTVKNNHGFTVSNKAIGYLSDEVSHSEIAISSVSIIGDTIKIKTAESIPEGYKLYCNVSDVCSNYETSLYTAQATDGTLFDPFDTLIDFVEEIVTYG